MARSHAGRAVLAIDVGGTKLAAGVVLDDGTVLARDQTATPATSDAEALFQVLASLSQHVVETAGLRVQALGVGCGGPMRYPEGEVAPLNIPAWRGFPLRARLAQAFALPCVVDNDAKAMALGEHWLGAGRGSRNMIGMVVSTGVGGGVIVDGRLLHGESGNAGHIGHLIAWPDGPLCGCGARGYVEAIASGTGIRRRLSEALAGPVATRVPPTATVAEVADFARSGDPLARRLFQEAGAAVGRGIASAAVLLDVELVAIGGSIALKAWDLLGPPLEAEVHRCAHHDRRRHSSRTSVPLWTPATAKLPVLVQHQITRPTGGAPYALRRSARAPVCQAVARSLP
ncbi:MAG: ROK family protein [Chloroflexi bacterium]|nr:ROK family protein [Chloroflexota bacterium]